MPDERLFENIRLWLPEPSFCAGSFAIPRISAIGAENLAKIEHWKPFGSGEPQENCAAHMFLDDYRIERLWNKPQKYVDALNKYAAVCAPDFSIYTDVPIALGIYNHYRKHWLATWWQQQGITVIPTICWGGEETFGWCFDGEPENSVVAVSSVGTQQKAFSKQLFMYGYDAMFERLNPSLVLFNGIVPIEAKGNIQQISTGHFAVRRKGG